MKARLSAAYPGWNDKKHVPSRLSCLAVSPIRKINFMAYKISNYLRLKILRDSVIADCSVLLVPFQYFVIKKITPNHNIGVP
jgi:hypothetical protein